MKSAECLHIKQDTPAISLARYLQKLANVSILLDADHLPWIGDNLKLKSPKSAKMLEADSFCQRCTRYRQPNTSSNPDHYTDSLYTKWGQ